MNCILYPRALYFTTIPEEIELGQISFVDTLKTSFFLPFRSARSRPPTQKGSCDKNNTKSAAPSLEVINRKNWSLFDTDVELDVYNLGLIYEIHLNDR